MAMTFEDSRGEIARLVEYFRANREAFLAPGVKEAHVRQSLIDPFFEALGWDVHNASRLPPQNREVIPEDSLDVEGERKAPDYTFRFGRLPRFYAEAKKCGVDVNSDPKPAYQLRRYGWSARLPLSILTDFEELGVYDCTIRPKITDKASCARILYFRFTEYADRWRELWDVFSREAVWFGGFDQFAASKRGKRGTTTVDAEFLKEIEGWRNVLARNIAIRNERVSPDNLNRAVQLIIDRIIFLRMAEARGLEPQDQLLRLSGQPDIYRRFVKELYRKADEKYNSGLFHFSEEPTVADPPDRVTPRLEVDDKVLKPIFQSLYFEHGSPYAFTVLPVEIIGTVYERFLGKVIRLTPDHHAKVEEKPEVRKAGGVYYTPAYIVDYIVKNTVEKQIEGKSPKELEGGRRNRTFRVLDMACGSGSFLLNAYQCLLDHCLNWYVENDPEKSKEAVFRDAKSGAWRLTIGEKKRILIAHIFGIDIDAQAVEVSKLSLLLKVLEGESDESVSRQAQLFHDRALPNLSDNIKPGNSLIGPDYFKGVLIPDAQEMKRVSPFDWKKQFPDAIRDGGFDAVIGNPPYIRIQTMKEWAPLEVEIYKKLYKSARSGNYDIYVVFIEAGLKHLNATGKLGFIVPHKFFNAKYGEPIRGIIAGGQHLAHAVHFGDQQVFDGATTYTVLLFLDKAGVEECRFVKVNDLAGWRESLTAAAADDERSKTGEAEPSPNVVREAAAAYSHRRRRPKGPTEEGVIPARKTTSAEWNFAIGKGARLFERLARMPVKLGSVSARIFQGLVTGCDPVFVLIRRSKGSYYSNATRQSYKLESELMHPLCKGSVDLKRYHVADLTKSVLFPYKLVQGKARLLNSRELAEHYPRAWDYLRETRALLKAREGGKWKHANWYTFGRSQNLSEMEQKKILTPSIARRASFTLDLSEFYYFLGSGGGGGGGYGITLHENDLHSYQYALGLLNSRLLDAYLKSCSSPFSGGYYAYNRQYIENLPIRSINFFDPHDKSRHDQIVSLVNQMMELHKRVARTKSESEKIAHQRQIDWTDGEIDRLVYDLYGLTKPEIAILESRG